MSHPRKDFEIYGKEITVTVGEKSGSSAFLGEYDGKTAYIAGYKGGEDKLAAKTCAVMKSLAGGMRSALSSSARKS